jgi:carboxypeptidase C (cathepsin A)
LKSRGLGNSRALHDTLSHFRGGAFPSCPRPCTCPPCCCWPPRRPALAQKAEKTETKTTETKDDDSKRPPLPADRTITQSARIGGRVVTYKATVGTIPVRDDKGKEIGQVVYTAYTVPGGDVRRPVTFAFNGGPGASSVYLNMGAVGPKRVQFGAGRCPSDAPVTTDNPNSWLDFTDLVFIDPIGTGFSRSLVDEAETKKPSMPTTRTSNICPRSSMTGWSRRAGCARPNM